MDGLIITSKVKIYDNQKYFCAYKTDLLLLKKYIYFFFKIVVGYIKNLSTFAPALQHKFIEGLQVAIDEGFRSFNHKTLKIWRLKDF